MVEHDTTPLHSPGSEPVTDANFAARLTAQRKAAGITQQALADRASIHVTQVRRYAPKPAGPKPNSPRGSTPTPGRSPATRTPKSPPASKPSFASPRSSTSPSTTSSSSQHPAAPSTRPARSSTPASPTYATVSKPKVVTVTIGGNDTQWAEFLGTCAMQDCTTMESQMRSRILSLRPGLANAYRAIKNAPEAKFADIVVGGYPVPVDPVNAASDTTSICAAFEMPEREMFARLTSSLNSVISGAASDAGVWSAAPYVQSRFRGHGACTYDAWLNDVDWDLGGDSQSGLIGPNSFHPTLGGQLAYALAFDDGFRAYSG